MQDAYKDQASKHLLTAISCDLVRVFVSCSLCGALSGFTPQYAGLEKLYKDHEAEGLVILGFPCNRYDRAPHHRAALHVLRARALHVVAHPTSASCRLFVVSPLSSFGSQEPGTEEEIQSFCSATYGVSFPVMAKIEVNGDNEAPVYKFLKSQKSGMLGLKRIKWNFEKFLVNKKGEVVERFSSLTKPEDMEKAIKAQLAIQ